jgi:hypothetical protein
MTVARDVLDRLAEIGATVRPSGDDRLIVRAGANPIPAELVRRLREAKTEVLAALAPAANPPDSLDRSGSERAWWHSHFTIRTIDRELGGTRSHAEAARLAWGELECRWHRLYGARLPEWRCAGCGSPIGGWRALPLGDGNRVHLDDARGLDCVIAYGERWRGAAARALAAMGLDPPPAEAAD